MVFIQLKDSYSCNCQSNRLHNGKHSLNSKGQHSSESTSKFQSLKLACISLKINNFCGLNEKKTSIVWFQK
jgi:hypothetical protein